MSTLPEWLVYCGAEWTESLVRAELLRAWSLSEVFRLTRQNRTTLIAKLCRGETAAELDVYEDILVPAQLGAPTLLAGYRVQEGAILLLEDLGPRNVEAEPKRAHFVEAAHKLARLRRRAAAHVQHGKLNHHAVHAEQYLADVDHLLNLLKEQKDLLRRARAVLEKHLVSLDHHVPRTLIHNDYHAKNLMIRDGRIVAVDWSSAYLGTHLGDLYCLVQEAIDYGIDATVLIEAYFSEADDTLDPASRQWQVELGGLCWSVRMLRWIAEKGVHAIPGSEAWILNFTRSIEALLSSPTLLNPV